MSDILSQQLSYETDAINHSLVALDCPEKFRSYIDCLVGISEGCHEFSAKDIDVANRARPEESRSEGAQRKWLKRIRNDFDKWQESQKILLIECRRGYAELRGCHSNGEPAFMGIPSRYRLHILALAEQVLVEAREDERYWVVAPLAAIEYAARRIARDYRQQEQLPMPRRSYERAPESKLKQQLRASATNARKATEILQQNQESDWLPYLVEEELQELDNQYAKLREWITAVRSSVKSEAA